MNITGTQYARREVWTPVQARISTGTLLQNEHTRDQVNALSCQTQCDFFFCKFYSLWTLGQRIGSFGKSVSKISCIQTEEFQIFRPFYQVIVKFSRNIFLPLFVHTLVNQTLKKKMSIRFTTCSLKLVNKHYRQLAEEIVYKS